MEWLEDHRCPRCGWFLSNFEVEVNGRPMVRVACRFCGWVAGYRPVLRVKERWKSWRRRQRPRRPR